MTYSRYGDDSVLELRDLDTPRVGPGEVLVRVKAASVNPVDWKIVSGGLDSLMMTVFPAVPGWDVAGVVEAVCSTPGAAAAGSLVLAQPDLGTSVMLVAGGGIMMFVAGVSLWYFAAVLGAGVGLVVTGSAKYMTTTIRR